MKKYIRICACCGNSFDTDKMTIVCDFCQERLEKNYNFYKNYLDKIGGKPRKVLIYPTGYIKVVQ